MIYLQWSKVIYQGLILKIWKTPTVRIKKHLAAWLTWETARKRGSTFFSERMYLFKNRVVKLKKYHSNPKVAVHINLLCFIRKFFWSNQPKIITSIDLIFVKLSESNTWITINYITIQRWHWFRPKWIIILFKKVEIVYDS